MKWTLFSKPSITNLDQRLVKRVGQRRWPSWSQFRYVNRFLTTTERRLMVAMLAVAAVVVVGLGTLFAGRHIAAVAASGGDYREALIGQPKYINPLFASGNDVDGDLAGLIYSPLFRYDQNEQLVGDLAANVTISADQKTYTVQLRHNVTWSDGEPFTAADVLATITMAQNVEVGSPYLSAFQGVKADRIDDATVSFTLKKPFAPFLHSLTIGILPEHIWASLSPSAIRLAGYNLQPVGTGPWQFSQLTKDGSGRIQSYQLKRNNNYYRPKPYFQTLTFQFYPDDESAIEAVRSQAVDALSFVPYQSQGRLAGKNLASYPLSLPQYTALFFNQTRDPRLTDADLRQALTLAIDKKTIVNGALRGQGQPVDTPFLHGMIGYDPGRPAAAFDIDQANARLDKKWPRLQPEKYFQLRYDALNKAMNANAKSAASSTPDLNKQKNDRLIADTIRKEMNSAQQFYRADKNNNILDLTITTVDAPEYLAVAGVIGKMWAAIGVHTTIQTVASQQVVNQALKTRNYQILLYGEIVGGDPDPFPFWHSSQTNYPGLNLALYASRDADKVLEDARATADETKRAALYRKFQDLLAKDIPAVFLYSPTHYIFINKRIQGVTINPLVTPSDRFNTLNSWYVNTGFRWKR